MADRRTAALAVTAAVLLASCTAGADDSDDSVVEIAVASAASSATTTATTTSTTTSTTSATTVVPTTSTTTLAPTTTSTTITAATTTTTTTTTTMTTTVPSATVPPIPEISPIVPIDPATVPFDVDVEIGRSVNGVPITVVRRGDPAGTRVLAVGVIHGNEADGVAIIDRLRTDPVPPDVELWLVRSMNPDGEAIGDRQNANLVDLNRNFPENWDVLGEPGFWQYGGAGPASEPETQALVALGAGVRPDIVLWYHQDLFRIAPGSGRAGEIRLRYAEVAGLPIVDISGGTYTGTASQWARTVIPDGGVGITVELGPTLSPDEVDRHVAAVGAIATEFF